MSVSNVKNGSHVQYGITDYVIDTTSELSSLPTGISMGSKAFCVEDNKYYILNGQKQWVEYKTGGGGGSSEDIETVAENFAPAYDETQTYSVGDLVVYEYVLYKCTTAVTTPEEFDSTKWEHTTLESSFEIDDSDTSAVKTWSSSKINTQIGLVNTHVDVVDTKATNTANTLANLLAPQAQKVYEWDFTDSLIDKIASKEVTLSGSGATQDSTGLTLNGGNATITNALTIDRTYEIEFGNSELSYTSGYASLVGYIGKEYYGTTSSFGLYQGNWGLWNYYGNYQASGVDINYQNTSFLNGGKLTLVVNSNSSITIYINGTLIGTFTLADFNITNSTLWLGNNATQFAMQSIKIRKLTVYAGTTNGEDILNRIEDLEDANTSYNSFITGTILTGEDTLTIQNASIISSTMFDIYSSVYSIVPDEVTVATGSITLSFDTAVESDVTYKIRLIEG